MSKELEPNPYAPPTGVSPTSDADATSEYAGERRSVALCVVLTFVTLGLYPAIWLRGRQPFLERLATTERLGSLPVVALVLQAAQVLLLFGGATLVPLRSFIGFAAGLTVLMASFRVKAMLQSDFRRTGRAMQLSGAGTFFFGINYLQYKMNQAADRPAVSYEPEPKKKKKKKKRRLAAGVDAPVREQKVEEEEKAE